MLLNVAVGGNWPGSPTTNTVFPQRMTVEYVRVYTATSTNCSLNALPNPGFELGGLANWSSFGGGANVSVQNSTNLPVHGGTNVLKLYGQFSGSDNLSGASRDLLVAPGASLVAAGYALTTSGDKIAGNNTGYLEVSFRDATTNVLSLYRSAFITSNSTAGVWYSLPVTNQLNPVTSAVIGTVTHLVAPAGTVLTRYRIVFHQPQTAAGSILFDDLSLAPDNAGDGSIPLSSGQIGGNFSLSFPTLAGQSYQVLWNSNLMSPTWSVLSSLVGNGAPVTIYDPLGAGGRLYSVLRVCK
jgi:hypothetical protein